MFKTKRLIVWAKESSMNTPRKIHMSLLDAYIEPSNIQILYEIDYPPNEEFGDWKDLEVKRWLTEFAERGKIMYPFRVVMKDGTHLANIIVTFDELNELLKLIEQGSS